MIARVEYLQSWLETVTYQMNNMVRPFSLNLLLFDSYLTVGTLQSYKEVSRHLAG